MYCLASIGRRIGDSAYGLGTITPRPRHELDGDGKKNPVITVYDDRQPLSCESFRFRASEGGAAHWTTLNRARTTEPRENYLMHERGKMESSPPL